MHLARTRGARRRDPARRLPATRAARRPVTAGRHSRGQSLVEFALVVPLFLLLVAGMVDFGMGLFSNITLINAVREGARLGVTSPGDTAAMEARVRSMSSGLNAADLAVSTSCERPDAAPATTYHACTSPAWQSGDAVVVTGRFTYRMIWPLAMGTTIPLTTTVRMRIE
jgi:Flp pilus assembly protein TadG